ncbi:MAG: sigma-70 family RNA polymerase sigma factor [Anaerolineales bacterium]|nr:sigma-70 family RNA polymerase sigma factor [Anaerolineales bacterium]
MQRDEGKWLGQALQGDAAAFASLVDMYAKPVYNLCYRMLGNPQDAEDAAQETFLRAFRHLRRYDPQRKFATWLLSIAANYCIDQHRRARPTLTALDEGPLEPAEKAPGPEGRALAREQRDEVQALLAGLAPRDRAAIILYYWYDHSYEEIARQLSISQGALKTRMHRARRSLAAAWAEEHGEPLFATRRSYEKAIP